MAHTRTETQPQGDVAASSSRSRVDTSSASAATLNDAPIRTADEQEWASVGLVPYEFIVWPSPTMPAFEPGDQVFVSLKSNKDTGRGVVLTRPALDDAEGEEEEEGGSAAGSKKQGQATAAAAGGVQQGQEAAAAAAAGGAQGEEQPQQQQQQQQAVAKSKAPRRKTRCLVRYHCCGTFYHVNVHRIARCYRSSHVRRVVLCHSTSEYRALARSQVEWDDYVVEIGSSYGVCTQILSQHARRVVGVEISEELVAASREAYSGLRFELLDVLQERRRAAELWRGADVVFVDIGGNRELSAVVRCLSLLFSASGTPPRLVVVKSQKLARAAKQHTQQRRAATAALASAAAAGAAAPTAAAVSSGAGAAAAAADKGAGAAAPRSAAEEAAATGLERLLLSQADGGGAACACSRIGKGGSSGGGEGEQQAGSGSSDTAAAGTTSAPPSPLPEPPYRPPEGLVPGGASWYLGLWRQHSMRAGAAGEPERWWLEARAEGWGRRNALRFPWRETADGSAICRMHNYYAACEAHARGECGYDHEHCHHCGGKGHVARECTLGA